MPEVTTSPVAAGGGIEARLKMLKAQAAERTTNWISTKCFVATSVSCERAFSRSKYYLSELRLGMSSATLEALMLCYWNKDFFSTEGELDDRKIMSLASKKSFRASVAELRAPIETIGEEEQAVDASGNALDMRQMYHLVEHGLEIEAEEEEDEEGYEKSWEEEMEEQEHRAAVEAEIQEEIQARKRAKTNN